MPKLTKMWDPSCHQDDFTCDSIGEYNKVLDEGQPSGYAEVVTHKCTSGQTYKSVGKELTRWELKQANKDGVEVIPLSSFIPIEVPDEEFMDAGRRETAGSFTELARDVAGVQPMPSSEKNESYMKAYGATQKQIDDRKFSTPEFRRAYYGTIDHQSSPAVLDDCYYHGRDTCSCSRCSVCNQRGTCRHLSK